MSKRRLLVETFCNPGKHWPHGFQLTSQKSLMPCSFIGSHSKKRGLGYFPAKYKFRIEKMLAVRRRSVSAIFSLTKQQDSVHTVKGTAVAHAPVLVATDYLLSAWHEFFYIVHLPSHIAISESVFVTVDGSN
jgi:hypothetical protein